MKWINKGKELENFYNTWRYKDNIVVFGLGKIGKSFIRQIKDDVKVKYIIDNDLSKSGQVFQGIQILHPSELNLLDYSILISSYYEDISDQVTELGHREDVTFCNIDKYVCSWYWYEFKKVHLPEVHIALTTKCTLNCKNCNMYMPYHKSSGEHLSLEKIIKSIDKLFSFTDRIYRFALLGGEPFLYPDLGKVISHITINYNDKIGELSIATNGTILPSDKILDLIKRNNILVSISDYTNTLNYVKKIEKLRDKLDVFKIPFIVNSSEFWLDFNFPHKALNIPDEKIEQNMHSCSPVFKGINDNKFYYCHIVWSAVKSGLLKENESDYLNLNDLNPENNADKISLLEYNLGFMDTGYISLCKMCGGCSRNNKMKVSPAIQMERIN